jgi:hypothetical protein
MGAVIWKDTRQHHGKHAVKEEWWESHGVPTVLKKLDFGDYQIDGSNVSVDTKQGLAEIAGNLSREHNRFRREVERANDAGFLLVVLVETNEAECLEDVRKWCNTHCLKCTYRHGGLCNPRDDGVCQRHGTKHPVQGEMLAKQMKTMESRYSVRFEFVRPENSAKRICELLGVKHDTKAESDTDDVSRNRVP